MPHPPIRSEGASTSPSSSQRPASTSSTASIPSIVIEPYDSPLRPSSATPAAQGYAGGGTHSPSLDDDEDGGDLGGGSLSSSAGRRDKGKGRAREEDYGRIVNEDGEVESQPDGEEEVDEEAEARRVAENLARWSRADAARRASLRRSSTLVYPSLPSPPPVPIPSASALVRRTSTLLRGASRRNRGGGDFGGMGEEELELGTPPAAGVAGRRGRRKLSVMIDSGRDGTGAGSSPTLPGVGEAEEEEALDPARTPTASSAAATPTSSTFAVHSAAAPTAAPLPPDPFSPTNASRVSLSSTATSPFVPSSGRPEKTVSRFIEDLPPLPLSPPSERSNPFMTPTTPNAAEQLPFSMDAVEERLEGTPRPAAAGGERNPFNDVVVISPPSSPPPAGARPPLHTKGSQRSVLTFASSTAPSFAAPSLSLAPTMSIPEPSFPLSPSPPLSPGARRRRPFTAASSPSFDDPLHYPRGNESGTQIGLLDWLLCGCFRAGGGQRDGGVEQQGRTNPME